MTCFEVTVKTWGREYYLIDADSEADARENWCEGTRIYSEVDDVDVLDVKVAPA